MQTGPLSKRFMPAERVLSILTCKTLDVIVHHLLVP